MSGTVPPPNVQIKLRLGSRSTTLPQFAQDGQTIRVIAEGFDRQSGGRREIDGVSFHVRHPAYAARLQWTPSHTERLSPYAVACDVEMPDPGEWRVRAVAEVPSRSADEIAVTIRASGMGDLARDPVLADEDGRPLTTPTGGLISVVRIDRAEPLEMFDRDVALAVAKGGQLRTSTLGAIFDAAGEVISGDVAVIAETRIEVAEAALQVENSRVEVVEAVEAVPEIARDAAAGVAVAEIAADVQAVERAAEAVEAGRAQVALDAATAEAQRALAELARALAEAAAGNAGQIAGVVQSDITRRDPAWSLADAAGNVALLLRSAGGFGMPAGEIAPGGDGLRVRDERGAVLATIDAMGLALKGGSLTPDGMLTLLRGLSMPKTELAEHSGDGLRVRDAGGSVLATLDAGGLEMSGPGRMGGLTLRNAVDMAIAEGDFAFRVRDSAGNVAMQIGSGGTMQSAAPVSAVLTDAEVLAQDLRARAASAEPARRVVAGVVTLAAALCHIIVNGQSLAEAYECHPAVSKAQPYDNLMLGLSTHSQGSGTTWPPFGSGFNPLIGTVRGTGGALLTPAEVAALAFGDDAIGEDVGISATNHLRRNWLDRRGVTASTAAPYSLCRFVSNTCGSGGQPVESFIPGAAAGRYGRYTDLLARAKAAAAALSLTYTVGAVLWMQGEANYPGGSVDATVAGYKAKLQTVLAAMQADAMTATGQDRPPAALIYQTGSTYVTAGSNVSVGEAQLQLALETPNVWMVGPSYPYPDKLGHLSANGSRWHGEKFGQVLSEILVERRDWRPLHPLWLRYRGRQWMASFHVPAPPLQFRPCYDIGVAATYANAGFAASDDAGVLPVIGVALAGDCTVRGSFGRDPVGTVFLHYADVGTRGAGNLCDSDPALAASSYAYLPEDGMDPEESIPDLNGKPYPLWNWCVGFRRAATAI